MLIDNVGTMFGSWMIMDVLGMCRNMTTFASLIGTGHPQHCAWACRFMKRPIGCHNKAGDAIERPVDD